MIDFLTYLRRLFEYDRWANREVLASLRRSGSAPERARRFLAHVVAVERLWLARLRQDGEAVTVWPELEIDAIADGIEEVGRAWAEYLAGLNPGDLIRNVDYVNSRGERWSSAVREMIMHTLLHSSYHRGQVAAELRRSGQEPAYTDFIHATRQGLVGRGA